MMALAWVYYSKRPLSNSELLHALAVDPDEQEELDYTDVLSQRVVSDICAGLLVFDSKNGSVRFAHYSVHEYLEATGPDRWFPQAQSSIARVCLRYLGSLKHTADSVTAALLASYPFLRYASQHWGSHASDGYHDGLDSLALTFLDDEVKVDLAARVLDETVDESTGGNEKPPPIRAAKNQAVQLCSRFGAVEFLNLLLALPHNRHSATETDPAGYTALHWAARGGHTTAALRLIAAGVVADADAACGKTPLQWASKKGHDATVAELLRCGADPAAVATDGRTALHWAASQGHADVVTRLLSDERVSACHKAKNGWTALDWAACSGNRAVTAYGVAREVNAPLVVHLMSGGNDYRGHEKVVLGLLDCGVNPNSRNTSGQTALHWAAASGNKKIIRLLLDRGADARVADQDGREPWQFARDNGTRDDVVRMLAGP